MKKLLILLLFPFLLTGCYITTHPFKTVLHTSTLGISYLIEEEYNYEKEQEAKREQFHKSFEAYLETLSPEERKIAILNMMNNYANNQSVYIQQQNNMATSFQNFNNQMQDISRKYQESQRNRIIYFTPEIIPKRANTTCYTDSLGYTHCNTEY